MKPMSKKVVFNRTTTTTASNANLNDKNTLFTMACVASMEHSLSTHQTARATVIVISQKIAIVVQVGLYSSIQTLDVQKDLRTGGTHFTCWLSEPVHTTPRTALGSRSCCRAGW